MYIFYTASVLKLLQRLICFYLQTTVMFGNNTLSMSEKQFANPEEFLPERWLDSNDPQKQRQMGMCVLPFGIGKRNCMGRRFAEQEIHLATIKVICILFFQSKRYDFLCMYTVNFECYLYTMYITL